MSFKVNKKESLQLLRIGSNILGGIAVCRMFERDLRHASWYCTAHVSTTCDLDATLYCPLFGAVSHRL